MEPFMDWGSWIREGHYVSFGDGDITTYEHIISRDFAHYLLDWNEIIAARTTSGPYIPADLEITRGYDRQKNTNNIWQLIFGIKRQVYVYIELPTDTHRHGLFKRPKPDQNLREVSHFEEYMSPFLAPSFLTEHIMMRPDAQQIAFDAYNPTNIPLRPQLNLMIAKLITERIGYEQDGDLWTPVIEDNERRTERLKRKWSDTLDKLYRRAIPHRPLTLYPVTGPATAPRGE